MSRIFLGVIIGIALAAGGAFAWSKKMDGCFGRCGDGTRCEANQCLAVIAATPMAAPAKTQRTRRRGSNGQNNGAGGDSPIAPEITLKPGDEKMVAQGDALGRPEHIDLTAPGDDGRELTQDLIDPVFHARDAAITKCITTTLGDAPLETGKIEIGLRVEHGGEVSRIRVEGPALLQRNGLTACIKKAVSGLRFPRSGGATVVTYPFELK